MGDDKGYNREASTSALPDCDASTAPTNAARNVYDLFSAGATCQPTCNNGYTVSVRVRVAGTLTAAM